MLKRVRKETKTKELRDLKNYLKAYIFDLRKLQNPNTFVTTCRVCLDICTSTKNDQRCKQCKSDGFHESPKKRGCKVRFYHYP